MSLVCKGRKFDSYEEVSQSMEHFQIENFFQMYIRDSKTIKSYLKRRPSREIKEDLRYVYLHYCCVHGGKKFESKSTGARPNTRTLKDCCPAEIKVSLTKDGKHLEVIAMEMNHNHDCNEVTFNHFPKQRKLDPELVKEASIMLSLNCDRKMLQSYLQNASGRVVTGKDISNLKQACFNRDSSDSTFEEIAEKLCQNKGSTTKIVTDADSNFLGIYYQDRAMKSAFEAFPEIMFVDASYKVKCSRMPLYVLLGQDGNGVSEIFALFLIPNEEEVTVRKMVNIFKETNPSWDRIVTIILDREFTEREVFSSEFPNAGLLLCLLHVQKTFKKDITTDRMGITNDERDEALDMLQKMTNAKTEVEYDRLHLQLKHTNLQGVFDYFEDNWHPIREHWVERLKIDNLAILNRSNFLVDSTNGRIRSLCSKCVTLDQFVDELLVLIQSLRTTKDYKAITICQRKPVLTCRDGTPEADYQTALTPYAFYWLRLQYNMLSNVKIPKGKEHFVKISSYVDKITVTESSCQCTFWTTMQLPCRHIMAFRRERDLDIYDSTLFAVRWTLEYYQLKHPILQLPSNSDLPSEAATTSISHQPLRNVLTQGQKYKKSYSICQKIASLVSECPTEVLNLKLDVLRQIHDQWHMGQEIAVQRVGHASDGPKEGEAGTEEDAEVHLEHLKTELQGRVEDEDGNGEYLEIDLKRLKEELQNDAEILNGQVPQDTCTTKESAAVAIDSFPLQANPS